MNTKHADIMAAINQKPVFDDDIKAALTKIVTEYKG